MTFRGWLKKQRERDDAIGDLARDMKRDKTLPSYKQSYKGLYDHLTLHMACEEALVALDEAWIEYKKETGTVETDRNIPLNLRWAILERDDYACVICGRGRSDGVKLEVDHIVPVTKGGMTILHNLQTLCFDCNRGKGNQ